MVKNREAWHAAVHGVTKSRTRLSDGTTTTICMPQSLHCPPEIFTTLLTGYAPIQNKMLKMKKKSNYINHISYIKNKQSTLKIQHFLIIHFLLQIGYVSVPSKDWQSRGWNVPISSRLLAPESHGCSLKLAEAGALRAQTSASMTCRAFLPRELDLHTPGQELLTVSTKTIKVIV